MTTPTKDEALYLEYLDKEMTIMGVLSAFAVAVPALVLDRLMGAEIQTPAAELWKTQRPAVLFGSIALFLAGLFFYRQRSLIAFYYGQISLSLTPGCYQESETVKLIHEAELWTTWSHYATAFACITIGFASYMVALLGDNLPSWLPSSPSARLGSITVVVFGALTVRYRVISTYPDEYKPWSALWRTIREKPKSRR
jgi:hypothetical protein